MVPNIFLSSVAASYIKNSPLGFQAQAADAEDKDINTIIDEKTSLTDKARYADANTSIVQAIKLNFESGVVGVKTGVQFKFKDENGILDREKNDKAEADWKLFCKKEFFEVKRKYHCDNILRQIVKAEKGAEGEVIVLHQIDTSLRFGYVIQLVETSMIDTSEDKPVKYKKDSKDIEEYAVVSGLQLGKYDRVEGIYIYDDGVTKASSTLYTKDQFTLYFNPHLRISQYRGISQISGVIGTVQDTMTYKDNELKASSAAALTKYVHKTPVIKPLRLKQDSYWATKFQNMNGIPSISSFATEDQSNSPTAFIGIDEDLTVLNKGDMKSTYSVFRTNEKETVSQNYGISTSSLTQGEDNAVFAVVKAKKQENETRYGIERNNLENMLFEDIINNFIWLNHRKWGIDDFYEDKYKYYYQYIVTMGTKTELDEKKSADARTLNLKNKTIDKYQSSLQLGNDYDTVIENNTRATQKDMEETIKLLEKLKELNTVAAPLGMRYKLDEYNNIVQAEEAIEVKPIKEEKE